MYGDATSLVLFFSFWQALYLLATKLLPPIFNHPTIHSYLPHKSTRSTLSTLAPPYLISTLHALLSAFRGLHHLFCLRSAPPLAKLILPANPLPVHLPYVPEIHRVLTTNTFFASYLLADLVHIVRLYPHVGALDTVLHHLAFALVAIIAGHYRLYPFMFSWLILGEASTPLLNLRWFLIKSGYGSTPFFGFVQTLFGLVFFLTRFFVYAIGLAHHLSILHHVIPHAPLWAVTITTAGVVVGFLINLSWLSKMYRILTSPPRTPSRRRSQPSDPSS